MHFTSYATFILSLIAIICNLEKAVKAQLDWFYLDHGAGSPVRCSPTQDMLECAGYDGSNCQWGEYGTSWSSYQKMSGVSPNNRVTVNCRHVWPPRDGSDACSVLGCYGPRCASVTRKRCPWYDEYMDGTKFNALQLECKELTPKAFGEVVKTFEVDSSMVNPSADEVPSNLRLYLYLGHSFVGDLSAKLEHEGKTVTLFTGQTSASAVRCGRWGIYMQINDNNANAPTIDGSKCFDSVNFGMGLLGLGYSGVFRAHSVGLQTFVGTSITGTWTLTITDPIQKSEIEFRYFYILFGDDNVANCDPKGGPIQNENSLFGMYSIGSTALVSIISCLGVFGVCLLIYFGIKGFGLMLEVKDKKGYKSVSLEDEV